MEQRNKKSICLSKAIGQSRMCVQRGRQGCEAAHGSRYLCVRLCIVGVMVQNRVQIDTVTVAWANCSVFAVACKSSFTSLLKPTKNDPAGLLFKNTQESHNLKVDVLGVNSSGNMVAALCSSKERAREPCLYVLCFENSETLTYDFSKVR